MELDYLKKKVQSEQSRHNRLLQVEAAHELSISRQCELLGVSRSSYYYGVQPHSESAENLAIMRQLDKLHLDYPYFGARRLLHHLPEPIVIR